MRPPVLGNAAERAADAHDLAGAILELTVCGRFQTGRNGLATLLDETHRIVGQSLEVECHHRRRSAEPGIVSFGDASMRRAVRSNRGLPRPIAFGDATSRALAEG